MESEHRIMLVDYVGELFSNDQKAENSQLVLPIGLMYLSSYLKSKMENVNISMIKSYVDFNGDEELFARVLDFQPEVIGIRCLSLDLPLLLTSVRSLRERYHKQDYIVVLGGPVTNAETAKVHDSNLFDYIVVNEGERAFYEIVDAHLHRRPVREGVPGIVYHLNNYRGAFIENLDELPFPDYTLVDFSKYDHFLNYGYNRSRQAVLVTSRGCPFRCSFCHNIMGRRARLRSAANVFEEIEHLYRTHDIHDFFIVDDIFNVNRPRALDVFDRIIRSGLDIHLYFPNGIRGDIIDRAYVDRMVEAGTRYVCFAVETASERLQREIRKNLKLQKLKELIQYTCDKDIMVNAFFLFGLPTETEEEALMTLEYAEELDKLYFPFIFFARYYEGTEMYRRARELGFSQEMLYHSVHQLYHNIDSYATPTLSNGFVRYLKNCFLYKIVFNRQRIAHALRVDRKFHAERQTLDTIHSLYNVEARSVREFEDYVEQLSNSSFVKRFSQRRPC